MAENQPLLDPSTTSPGLIAREISHEPQFASLDDEVSNITNYGSTSLNTQERNAELVQVTVNNNEEEEDSEEPILTPARQRIILFSIYISIFLGALDTTIVATLLTIIASELDALPLISWIATSYLLSCSAFQPLFGKISNIFGRKAILLICNAMFVVGCLMCGLTSNFYVLIAGRFITGIGGGGFNTLGTITMSDFIPLRKRGVYQGFGNIAFGLGAASGGVVAGVIQSYFGWRWAFLIQIPICLIAGFCILLYLNLPEGSPGLGVQGKHDVWQKLQKIDIVGSVVLVISLIMFMLAASEGGKGLGYSNPWFIALIASSLIGLIGFYYYELLAASEPVIPVYLLQQPTVIFSSLNCWFMSMAMFTNLYFAPLFWISVKNLSSTQSGIRLISNFCGVSIGSVFAGLYMKNTGRYYNLATFSGIVTIIGVVGIYMLGLKSSDSYELTVMFLPGFGLAVMLTVSLVAMISSVSHKEQALTTSIQYGFRSVGSTLGVSVASACFQTSLVKNLSGNFANLPNIPDKYHSPDAIEKIINKALHDSSYAHKAAPGFAKSPIINAYDSACHAAMLFSIVASVLSVFCNFFIKEHRLSSSVKRN